MEIYGCTYKEYVKQYGNRLELYLERYEDPTEITFLERELVNFHDFHNVLVSIYNSIIHHKNPLKLVDDVQFKTHLTYLLNNYGNIYKELFQCGPPNVRVNKNVSHPNEIKEENIVGYIFYIDPTKQKLDNLIISTKRILEFIKKKLTKPPSSDISESKTNLESTNTEENLEKPLNPYPQVFSSPEAYKLFEKLHETYKDTKNPLADYSFIYRMMVLDGFILDSYKSQMFINWLSDKPCKIHIDKIKTLDNCKTKSKIQTYSTIKEMLQIK